MSQEPRPSETSTADLLLIPGIGPGKARLLSEAGFPDLASLKAAPLEEIASVRSIGPSLARRIKDFVDASLPEELMPAADVQQTVDLIQEAETLTDAFLLAAQEASEAGDSEKADILFAAAEESAAVEQAAAMSLSQAIEEALVPPEEAAKPSQDRWLCQLQEALSHIGVALQTLSDGLEERTFRKKLARQLERALSLLGNLPPFENLDRAQQKAMAKTLTRLAALFDALISPKSPGKKKQTIIASKLKQGRKKLARISQQ